MRHRIIGDDIQAVIVELDSSETVRAEAGAMLYMSESIEMRTQMGTSEGGGLLGSLMSGVKRAVAGDSFFITTFTAERGQGEVAFSAPYPGKIMPVSLSETGPLLCQRDSYLCSDTQVNITVAFTKRLGAGFFGGEGFILQKLTGSGQAFIHAGGGMTPFDLATGESLRVDTGCLVAMTQSIDYDIQMVKGVKNMLFGGDGLFLAKLTGPGRVWLQIMPFSRLANRVLSAASLGSAEQSKGIAGIGGDLLGGFISGSD